jgi:transcriptional regulator with XRE-family HTH domain
MARTAQPKRSEENQFLKDFGRRLRQLREKRGLSQAGLAQMIGVHKGQLLRYEHGQTSPTAEKVVALARVLRVTADALLRGDRKGEEPLEFDNIRLYEQMRVLDQLPRGDQETVLDLIDAVIARHEVTHVVERRRTSGAR